MTKLDFGTMGTSVMVHGEAEAAGSSVWCAACALCGACGMTVAAWAGLSAFASF